MLEYNTLNEAPPGSPETVNCLSTLVAFGYLYTMKFSVGQFVRFLDAVGQGRVTAIISDNEVMVEDETGFEYPYPVKQLVPIGDMRSEVEAYRISTPETREVLSRNIDPAAAKKAQKDFNLKYKNPDAGNMRKRGDYIEVDLHIHELVDNTTGLENEDVVQIQINHFERMMRIAEEKKIPRVILIHGVGQGVLRAEIRKSLEQYYPNATYHDADFRVYGYGATEVILRRR